MSKAEEGDPRHPERSETTGEPKSIEHPESGTRLSAKQIHANVLGSAEDELERSASSLGLSAIAAGLTIGFSFLFGAWLRGFAPEELKPLMVTIAYPLGFVFVVLSRNELFTENTLEPVIPLLHKRDGRTFRLMMRLWGILIVGNLVGALVFALVFAWTAAVPEKLRADLFEVAREATSGSFGPNFYRAIFAGWLLALLTWLLASTQERLTQVLLIVLATMPIAALEFRHSIAGSVEAFYLAAVGGATWGAMIMDFVIPVILGNALGGVTIVALLNFGQVASEGE